MKEIKKTLYNENFKLLKKEIDENIKWKDCTFHELVESVLLEWLYYQNNVYVQCNPHQTSNDILHRQKFNPKVHLKHKI
jgi:hypothetical protein